MKRLFLILPIAALVLMTSCIKDGIGGADLKPGDMLPDFEVVMSDGSTISDDSLKGTVSVIVFFSTICPDCQQVLPVVQDIYEEYTSKGVVFALVSRSQGKEDICDYWTANGLYIPYSAQQGRDVYEKFAKSGIPRIYIYDKDGIIRYIHTDDPVPSYSELCASLDAVIR